MFRKWMKAFLAPTKPASCSRKGCVRRLALEHLEARTVPAAPVAVADAYTVAEDSALVVPAPTGPVLRYGFDEAASGTQAALDSGIAPSANATLQSGATRTGNTPGGASRGALDLTLEDFNSTFATAGDVNKVDGLPALTVSVWVNLRAAALDNDVLLSDIPTTSDPGGTGGWDLTFTSFAGGIFPVFQVHEQDSPGSARAVGKILVGVDAQAAWTFLAFTYTPSQVLTTYNGSETAPVAQNGGATLAGIPLRGNNAPLSIGRSSRQTSNFDSTPPAWIDDVRIYDRALSAAELEVVRQQALTPGGGVLANDTDADGDPLTAALVDGPANGDLAFFPDGSFHYLPDPNFHGTDSFTYRASDGVLQSASATVTITVTPVNDAPVAQIDTYVTDEDTPLTIAAPGILGNDTDVDGDALSFSRVLAPPLLGTLAVNADGSFTYTPTPNFFGLETIIYKPTDGQLESANNGIIRITINPVNDPPAAADDSATVAEDSGAIAIDVLANDSLQFDEFGDLDEALAIVSVTQPVGGTVAFTATGLTYTPNANFFGSNSFTYTVTDSNGGGTDTATVTVTVTPVADAPVAVDDEATTMDAAAVTVAVLTNDTDPDGDPLSVASVTQPAHGTAAVNADGTVTYTPAGNFAGADSFTYTIGDGTGRSDVGTVTIRVLPRIFISDVAVTEGDSGDTFADFTVSLSNASPDTISVRGDSSNDTGTAGTDYTAVVGSIGTFAPGITSLTFRVVVTGDTLDEPDETFFVDLSNATNAVIADGQGVGTILDDDPPDVDLSLSGSPLAEAGGVATVTATLSSLHDAAVSVVLSLGGTAASGADYTPSATTVVIPAGSLSGSITLTGIDDALDEIDETIVVGIASLTNATPGSPAEVTATIADDDAAPTISIGDVTVTEGDSGDTFADFTVSLSAPSGKIVQVTGNTADDTATAGTDYTAVVGSTGTFAPGVTSLTFRVLVTGDSLGEPDETFFVDLSNATNAVIADGQGVGTILDDDNQPPVTVDDDVATDEDAPVTIDVRANDTDADGDALTATVVSGPANGTLTANADGTFTYTPDADFNGADNFSYVVSDGSVDSNIAIVTITVKAVNDAPTLTVPGGQTTPEDVAVTITGISVADVDVGEGTGVVRVTLSVSSGTLSVPNNVPGGLIAGQISGNGAGTVVLEGQITSVNATLAAGVTYLGNLNFNGSDILLVTVGDLGNTGSGGPRTATADVLIRVLSPVEQLADLRSLVESLRDQGALNRGQTNALLQKLDQVEQKVERGQPKVAYNVLGAFSNQVEDLLANGILTTEEADLFLIPARLLREGLLIGGGF